MLSHQINKILKNNKSLVLAYDQGFEHGPVDFDLRNIDPEFVIGIAEQAKFNALVLHHGIAEKYYSTFKNTISLIIKLNGKTNIPKIEPISKQVCSVKRAIKLGAELVGYTIYVGSIHEAKMFEEFGKIVEEAHDYGIPVIAWCYPRGQYVKDPYSVEMTAYAARIALELGADFVKLSYNNDIKGFTWAVKAAGRTKVLVAGGSKKSDYEFLQQTYDIMQTGAIGLAVGRNIWQHQQPMKMADAIKRIVFDGKTPDEVLQLLK